MNQIVLYNILLCLILDISAMCHGPWDQAPTITTYNGLQLGFTYTITLTTNLLTVALYYYCSLQCGFNNTSSLRVSRGGAEGNSSECKTPPFYVFGFRTHSEVYYILSKPCPWEYA